MTGGVCPYSHDITNYDDSNYCRECGEELVAKKKCPLCGIEIYANYYKFCRICGFDLREKKVNKSWLSRLF